MSMFTLPAQITTASARQVLQIGLDALKGGCTALDFSAVQQIDSSAVAALLSWMRAARAQQSPLEFHHLPANLLSLIQMYGVEELILPHHRH